MALQLTIIKFPPGVSLVEDRKTFGPQGGVIGRGVDNDWVLSDPERFLSSKHCQVTREGERYYLTDLSTNGTFVNGSSEPLGRGSRTALNDGDSFDLGDYRFKVVLLRDPGAADAGLDPFAGGFGTAEPFGEPFGAAGEPFGSSGSYDMPDHFGVGSGAMPESLFMSPDYKGAVQDITPDALKITDPLLALDNANRDSGRGLPERDPFKDPFKKDSFKKDPFKDSFSDPFAASGSREDSANLMSEAVAWPDSRQESGMLPEDWADDISLMGGQKSDAKNFLPEDDDLLGGPAKGRDVPVKADPLGKLAPDPQATGARPAKERTPPRETVPPKNTSSKPMPGGAGKAAQQRPEQRPVNPRQTGTRAPVVEDKPQPQPTKARMSPPGALDRTLVDAMGLGDVELSDDQIREIHATTGAMMRETLEGLIQVLRSRTSIKNEFRINVTTIQPMENNPIKFSANVDEVLELMFLRRSRAYKAPLAAVEESFHAIADHQLAVIAGIRSAFRSVLNKFEPERLEEEFKQTGKGGLLPGVMKGKFWGAYQEHYQKVINDMERSFQELFGDEFVQAYEDQMRKLSQARKRDL